MSDDQIDLLIIADKGGYENIAFGTSLSELVLDDEVMTLQKLKSYFIKKLGGQSSPMAKANVDLTQTGKLNGIALYNYCTRNGLYVELLNEIDEDRLKVIALHPPRCIAISTTWFLSKKEVIPLVKKVREYFPDSFIVLGGPLVLNSYLLHTLLETDYDTNRPAGDYFFLEASDPELMHDIDLFVIEQQGEKQLVEICRKLLSNRDPRDTSNCAFYKKDELIFTERKEEGIPLDENAIDWGKLPEHLLPEIVPMQLSTGCPFKCAFCNFVHRKRILKKSKEVIRQEIKSLLGRKKVRHLRIINDTMSPRDLRNLCHVMLEERFSIPWTTFARADSIASDIPELLKKAHCTSVQVGIESCDNGVLKDMRKKATVELYAEILHNLAMAGITTRASLIMGHPGETEQTIDTTIRFLNSLSYEGEGIFEFLFAPFFLIPLSPIYEPAVRKKYELDGYMAQWSHRTMSSQDVPNLMKKAFFAIEDHIFFAYIRDDVLPDLPAHVVRQIKEARQKARKLQLASQLEGKGPDQDFTAVIQTLQDLYSSYR